MKIGEFSYFCFAYKCVIPKFQLETMKRRRKLAEKRKASQSPGSPDLF